MGHSNRPIKWLNSIGSFPLLTNREVCYTKQSELLFHFSHDFFPLTGGFKTDQDVHGTLNPAFCITYCDKKSSLRGKKHCFLLLLQQSPDIVLIEEERTLFSTTDPYQDIEDLKHKSKMEICKVMIFNSKLILSKHDRTHLLLMAWTVLVFLAAGEWSFSSASSFSSMSGNFIYIIGFNTD